MERPLPHSSESERSLLGLLFVVPERINETDLRAEEFFEPDHRVIYGAMLELGPSKINPVTVASEIERKGATISRAYLASLGDGVPPSSPLDAFVDTVRECYQKRCLIRLLDDGIELSMNGAGFDECFSSVQSSMTRVLPPTGSFHPFSEVLEATLDDVYKGEGACGITGVPTGFAGIDEMTTGLQPGDLWLVAGRPSKGKTAFVLDVARHSVKNGKSVALFSLEMTRKQLVLRMIAAESRVNTMEMRKGRIGTEQAERIDSAAERMKSYRLHINDTPGIDITTFASKCRRLHTLKGVDLIILDYIQIMDMPGKHSRVVEVGRISRGLKILAMDLGIPVLAVSQLSRGSEYDARKPVLSDLRDSGSLEQDADTVLFVHQEKKDGQREIILSKQRNGPVGSIHLGFDGRFATFTD